MNIDMKKVKKLAILGTAVGYFALSKYCEKLNEDKDNSVSTSTVDEDENNECSSNCFLTLPSTEENI